MDANMLTQTNQEATHLSTQMTPQTSSALFVQSPIDQPTTGQLSTVQATVRQSNLIKVMVTVERPSSEDLAQYNRREKYQILQKNAEKQQTQLHDWIDEHGYRSEVVQIGDSNAFNVLFVECTRRVAEQLSKAPGVVSASPAY